MLNRIALGTAQLGMKYGVSNRAGKVSRKDAFGILEYAGKKGIDTLDTAYSYGDSEEVIGDFIAGSNAPFNVVSKLPDLGNDTVRGEEYCRQSLKRLKQKNIYGYLIHSFENLIRRNEIWAEMEFLKSKGLVKKIGFSLYMPEELEFLMNNNINFDIIQAPYNIFDRRFEKYFGVLKERGAEVHARSVFLQGLFFLDEDKIGSNFNPAKDAMERLHSVSSDRGISVHSLCLCFVLLNSFVDKAVIGVDSVEQLEEDISSLNDINRVKDILDILRTFEFHNEEIILPHKWTL